MRTSLRLAAALLLVSSSAVIAEADGPDYWRVSGVTANDHLMVHTEPTARSPVIGKLAHDAIGLRNRGCTNVPSFSEWQKMSASQRERSARGRWCRIESGGIKGWVAGRFLAEGPAPNETGKSVAVGAWTVGCHDKGCAIEQKGVAAHRPTVLRIVPVPSNARIEIVRANPPRSGSLSIYADGDTISVGPIAQLKRTPNSLAMEPDDITLGLLKRFGRHSNMVISFPGEERGVEFHVEKFDEAMKELERVKSARQ